MIMITTNYFCCGLSGMLSSLIILIQNIEKVIAIYSFVPDMTIQIKIN